jgi:hypothetical protein
MSSWWRVHECVLETDGVHAFGSVAIMRPVWRAIVSLLGYRWPWESMTAEVLECVDWLWIRLETGSHGECAAQNVENGQVADRPRTCV